MKRKKTISFLANKKNTTLTIIVMFFALGLYGQDQNSNTIIEKTPYLWCLLGCVLQEFLYWFELKHEIAKGNIPPALKSKAYWIITFLAIALFSIASYLYFLYGENGSPNFFTTAAFSAGFARLFKGAVSSLQSPDPQTEARYITQSEGKKEVTKSFSFKDYLMMTK